MTGVAYFVTTSRGKVAEAQIALLSLGIEVIQLDPGNLEEVLSLDLLLVSRQKALAAYNKYQVPRWKFKRFKGFPEACRRSSSTG